MPEPNWSLLEHFTRHEFVCRCGCGRADMDEGFVVMLDNARRLAGVAFHVNSGFRCPRHDRRVGTSADPGGGPHTKGIAADIAWPREHARAILRGAVQADIPAIIMQGAGPDDNRYVHLGKAPEVTSTY